MFYWLLKYVLLGPFIQICNRPTVNGVENIPADGAAIMAGNHLSIADWLFAPLTSPRRINYLAKAEYFTGRGIKGKLKKFFFTASGQFPIDRSSGDAAEDALVAARKLLDRGRLVGLYPEGTRSPDGRLYKGKTGMARLALETGVPVIPVAIVGTDRVSPPGPFRWRRRKVTITYGKPIDFSRYEGMGGNRFIERAVTDEVMYELMLLTGQEYVDVYAASLKNGVPSGPESHTPRIPESAAG